MLVICYRLYRTTDTEEHLALAACLVVAVPALNLVTSDAAAVAGLLVTGLTVWLVSLTGKSRPRFWPADFFPVFYTCHLAALGVLAM